MGNVGINCLEKQKEIVRQNSDQFDVNNIAQENRSFLSDIDSEFNRSITPLEMHSKNEISTTLHSHNGWAFNTNHPNIKDFIFEKSLENSKKDLLNQSSSSKLKSIKEHGKWEDHSIKCHQIKEMAFKEDFASLQPF